MSRTSKRPVNAGETSDDDREDLVELTEEEREEEDTEAVIAAEFGKGERDVTWAVKVWRAAAKGEKEPYLFTCSPSELPIIDRLRDEYGSGTYRVRVFKNNRVWRYYTVAIEAPPRSERPQQQVQQPINDGMQTLAQQMQRQADLIERLLLERRQPLEQSNQLEIIATVFGLIEKTRGMFAPQGNPASETIDLFLKGVDAAKELGSGGGESSLTDIIRDLLKSPMLQKMLENAGNPVPHVPQVVHRQPGIGEMPQSPQPQQPTSQTDQPQPNGNDVSTDQQGASQEQVIAAMLQHNIRYLCTKASQNADVDLYADWVLDNVPKEILQGLANDPNALQTIAGYVPEVQNYSMWFARLLASLQGALTEDGDDTQDAEHVQSPSASSAHGIT